MRPLRDLGDGLRAVFGSGRVQMLLALTATLIAIASVFYCWVEGWRPIDSVYFSVVTIATVGYGDFAPRTDLGKLFTIFYVIVGLGIFVATATAIADGIIARIREKEEGRREARGDD